MPTEPTEIPPEGVVLSPSEARLRAFHAGRGPRRRTAWLVALGALVLVWALVAQPLLGDAPSRRATIVGVLLCLAPLLPRLQSPERARRRFRAAVADAGGAPWLVRRVWSRTAVVRLHRTTTSRRREVLRVASAVVLAAALLPLLTILTFEIESTLAIRWAAAIALLSTGVLVALARPALAVAVAFEPFPWLVGGRGGLRLACDAGRAAGARLGDVRLLWIRETEAAGQGGWEVRCMGALAPARRGEPGDLPGVLDVEFEIPPGLPGTDELGDPAHRWELVVAAETADGPCVGGVPAPVWAPPSDGAAEAPEGAERRNGLP